jgi:hypothetical protein
MNEEKLIEILKNIGQADVPPNIAHIAEQTSQGFATTLNVLQSQRPPLATFFIGFKRLAVAAVILFTFAVGLSVGRWAIPSQSTSAAIEVAAYTSSMPTHPAEQENQNSFWRQKMLAAMQPRPYARTNFDKAGLLNDYKQYLKEKYND